MGNVTNALAVKQAEAAERVSPRKTVSDMLERNKGAISLSLPSGFNADRFSRLLLTAANTNPALFECDPPSFLAAGVAAAQLGLEPNDARGLAYLLPYNDSKRGKIVQLIIGYRGMMDLARRSGMVSSINAFPVYEGDEFTYALGLEPTLHHVPADGDEDPKKMTHVYAVARVNGDPQFVVMTRKQVDKTRASVKGSDSPYSPWSKHYVEMARKSAIRRLCKYLPQTVEMAQAIATEERPLSLSDMGQITYDGAEHDAIDVDLETGEITQGELVP